MATREHDVRGRPPNNKRTCNGPQDVVPAIRRVRCADDVAPVVAVVRVVAQQISEPVQC